MARLFRSQISNFCSSVEKKNFQDIVSPTGAYSVKTLVSIAAKNQALPPMHTYSISKAPQDLSVKTDKVTDITSAVALSEKNAMYEKQANEKKESLRKEKELQQQAEYDAEVIRKYKESLNNE